MINYACLLTLISTMLCLPGCSVDEFRNVHRKQSRAECMRAGGTPITDKFCLIEDAGTPIRDAAVRDASDEDADTADAAVDAGASMRCAIEGELESCSTQSTATSQQPPCKPGTRECRDGVFGECVGERVPEQESCNGEDDDCDGKADEATSGATDCEVEGLLGECARGVEVCDKGQALCLQKNAPLSDVCDGFDNDCDGETDEDTAVVCYPDGIPGCEKNEAGEYECVGTCRTGTTTCIDGAYEEACGGDGAGPDDADVCTIDGETSGDEDCDGKVDEGCGCSAGGSCYTGPAATRDIGPCHAGTWDCSNDTHTCMGEVKPSPETCANPGVDDDCDGTMDNVPMLDTSCAEQSAEQGICKANARWQCVGSVRTCVNGVAGAEVCDAQNSDEDCDGMANENFTLATDEENCGACGVRCAAGLQCCDGRCVNTNTSNSDCSVCGRQCAPGQTCCGGGCVNTLNNAMHCGSCGTVCNMGLLPSCKNGACTKVL